jgi:IclR family acetate operon transcriptional repressor
VIQATVSTQNQYVMNSAFRTLQVLLAFGAPPHRYSLAELTARMGLEKNQVYRSLKTLEEAGFLRADADGRFALTPILGVLNAAAAGSPQASLVELAAPHLDRLAAATGESVNLFVLAGDTVVCVDRRDSPHLVRIASVLGHSVTLHAGAVPKAVLAHLPAPERERVLAQLPGLTRYTTRTVLDAGALRAELELTRERGYSISDEDVDAGGRGVGAPVFDHAGRVVGGISVGGPSSRVDDAAVRRLGTLIVPVARAISRQLGYAG